MSIYLSIDLYVGNITHKKISLSTRNCCHLINTRQIKVCEYTKQTQNNTTQKYVNVFLCFFSLYLTVPRTHRNPFFTGERSNENWKCKWQKFSYIFHSVFSVFSDNDRAKANHQEEEGKTDWKITPTKTTEYNNNNQQPTKILYVLYFNVECIGGEWEGYGGERLGWCMGKNLTTFSLNIVCMSADCFGLRNTIYTVILYSIWILVAFREFFFSPAFFCIFHRFYSFSNVLLCISVFFFINIIHFPLLYRVYVWIVRQSTIFQL